MSTPRADFTALRSKVADAIKYASGPISSNEIGKTIGHVPAEGDPFKNYAITNVVNYMRSRNWLDAVVMVEIPRCTLKLLVKHALGNSPLEPVLQRAVMQCVEKLL